MPQPKKRNDNEFEDNVFLIIIECILPAANVYIIMNNSILLFQSPIQLPQ